MTSKIKNMQQLRDHALDTLEKLADGSIDTAQAGVTGKLCESVISTVKSQLEYSRMIGDAPNIPFMQTCHDNNGRLIEHIPAAKALKHEKH